MDAGAGNDDGKGGNPPDYWKREKEELIKDRQSLKTKLTAIEAKQKEDEANRLKETQKWEEAYNKEVPSLKTELETFKTKWTAHEEKLTARVTEKESKLTKENKDEYEKFISKLPLEDRDEWLSLRTQTTNPASPANGRPGATGNPVPFEKLPFEERKKLAEPEERFKLAAQYRDNPTALHKMMG